MKNYDVIIIGAGVSGASIARELSRYRLRIAVLEKEQETAFGVSKSNSGIIHPGTQNNPASLKGRLCVQGNALIRTIARELGVDFKEVGELIVAFDRQGQERLLNIKRDAQLLGVKRLRFVDSKWLRAHEPNLSPKVTRALLAPTAGVISPYRLVYDLEENAIKNGVEFFNLQEVVAICREENHFLLQTRVSTFRAARIINCAGLFADEVSRMAGAADSFRIYPRKGEEFLLDKKKTNLTSRLIFPLPEKNSKGILIIKTADGNPMLGPTALDVSDKQDLTTTQDGFQRVIEAAKNLVPGINPQDIIAYFAGLRPVAGDDFIIRHESGVPGFINVAGIQSPGLTAAPAVALMVAGILRSTGLVLRKKRIFHAHRRKSVHLFSMPYSSTARLIKKDPAYGDIVCRCETVSAREINDAIDRGASTLDGIKFRTRAQAGRCHGTFCTARLIKILAEKKGIPLTRVSKRGPGSELLKERNE